MARGSLLQAIPIATELEREARAGQQVAIPQSDGMAEAVGGLAREFGQIGQRIGQLADHAAQVEGRDAGHLAGMDPEFRPGKAMTIRGEAFDKAGLDTYKARVHVEIGNEIEALQMRHQASPEKLGAELQERRKGWLENSPAELRPEIENYFAKGGMAAMREATRQVWARQAAEQTGALQEELARAMRSTHQQAFALGLDPQADAAAADNVANLQRILGRTGPNGQRLVSPAQAAKMVEDAKREVAQARLLGTFERLPDAESKRRFIDRLDEDFAAGTGIAAQFDFDQLRQTRTMLEVELNRERGRHSMATQALARDVEGIAKRAAKGFTTGPEVIERLRATVATSGDEKLSAALQEAEGVLAFQMAARQQTPEQLDDFVRAETERVRGNASDGEVARIEVARKLAAEARVELAKDPNGWADRVGVVKLAPLDLSSPEAAAKSVEQRIVQAEHVASTYRQQPQYLRPDEVRRLAAVVSKGGTASVVVFSAIAATAGDRAPALLAELGKDAPVAAHIGALHVAIGGEVPPAVVSDAANGLGLLRTEGYKRNGPSADQAREVAVLVHKGALAGLPQTEQALIGATNAAYEVRAQLRKLTDFDPELWGQTFREMTGETQARGTTYGGIVMSRPPRFFGDGTAPVLVPPNVKQAGFRELVNAVRPDDFGADGPRYGDGRLATRADIAQAALVQAGDGRYWLNLGTSEQPQYLVGPDNKTKFELDLKALEPRLKERRPDLYFGGEGKQPQRQSTLIDGLGGLGQELFGVKPANAIFVGEGAKEADQAALAAAKQAQAEGKAPDQIWKQHGWYQAPDGKWRSEIDDSGAKLTERAAGLISSGGSRRQDTSMLAGELLVHDDLFASYPELAGIEVVFDPRITHTAEYDNNAKITVGRKALQSPEFFRKTLLHELQHAVAGVEQFAYWRPERGAKGYMTRPGEAEAYNAEARADMESVARRGKPPWETVPAEHTPVLWQGAVPIPRPAGMMRLGGPDTPPANDQVEPPVPQVEPGAEYPVGTPAEVVDGLKEIETRLGLGPVEAERLRGMLYTDQGLDLLEEVMQAPDNVRGVYARRLLERMEKAYGAVRAKPKGQQ